MPRRGVGSPDELKRLLTGAFDCAKAPNTGAHSRRRAARTLWRRAAERRPPARPPAAGRERRRRHHRQRGALPRHGHPRGTGTPPPRPRSFCETRYATGIRAQKENLSLFICRLIKAPQKHTEPRFTNCSLRGLLMIRNWHFRRCSWCLHSLLRGLVC